MRERRRSGRRVLPATRPPAGRALPGVNIERPRAQALPEQDLSLLTVRDDHGEAADPAPAAASD